MCSESAVRQCGEQKVHGREEDEEEEEEEGEKEKEDEEEKKEEEEKKKEEEKERKQWRLGVAGPKTQHGCGPQSESLPLQIDI